MPKSRDDMKIYKALSLHLVTLAASSVKKMQGWVAIPAKPLLRG